MTADLRRLVKNYGDVPNSLVCTLGKKITKKRNVREGYISPLCSAYPPKPLLTPWCMLGPIVRSQYSTVVLTVVRVMIAKYRKSGIWGYRRFLTPEPVELK